LMPDVQGFREYDSLLALRARLEMADGQLDKAVYTLQTGFAMSRHIALAPTMINYLVGVAIAHIMVVQVETLMQQPGAANLYWALTVLPRPFAELRHSLQGERLMLLAEFPELKDIETTKLSDQQQRKLFDHLVGAFRTWVGLALEGHSSKALDKAGLLAMITRAYPEAKKQLAAWEFKAADIEAMPAIQVVAIYWFREFRKIQDDMSKW